MPVAATGRESIVAGGRAPRDDCAIPWRGVAVGLRGPAGEAVATVGAEGDQTEAAGQEKRAGGGGFGDGADFVLMKIAGGGLVDPRSAAVGAAGKGDLVLRCRAGAVEDGPGEAGRAAGDVVSNDRVAAGDAGGTAGGGIVFIRDERGAGTDVEGGAGAAPEVDLAEGGGIAGGVEGAGGVAGPRAEARPVVRVPAETVVPPE